MTLFGLRAKGENLCGFLQESYSRNIYTTPEKAKAYIPEWKKKITDREKFLAYGDDVEITLVDYVLID